MARPRRGRLDEHFVEAPGEWVRAKADLFRVRPDDVTKESLWICELKRLLKKILGKEWIEINPRIPPGDPVIDVLPVLGQLDSLVHTVKAESLDHLKELIGVPNQSILAAQRLASHSSPTDAKSPRASRAKGRAEGIEAPAYFFQERLMSPQSVRFDHLPDVDRIAFDELNAEQRVAVKNQAFNLVYGYADSELTSRRPLSAVRDYVMEKAGELPVLGAQNLVVCDGETVKFSGFSSLWFNNVIIEGSGEIELGQNTKLHAHQIKRVPV